MSKDNLVIHMNLKNYHLFLTFFLFFSGGTSGSTFGSTGFGSSNTGSTGFGSSPAGGGGGSFSSWR